MTSPTSPVPILPHDLTNALLKPDTVKEDFSAQFDQQLHELEVRDRHAWSGPSLGRVVPSVMVCGTERECDSRAMSCVLHRDLVAQAAGTMGEDTQPQVC